MSNTPVWSDYLQALAQLQRLLRDDDPEIDTLSSASQRVQQAYAKLQHQAEHADDPAGESAQAQQALSLVRSIQQRADHLCRQWRSAGTLDDRRRRVLGAYALSLRQGDARYLDQRR